MNKQIEAKVSQAIEDQKQAVLRAQEAKYATARAYKSAEAAYEDAKLTLDRLVDMRIMIDKNVEANGFDSDGAKAVIERWARTFITDKGDAK